MHTSKIRKKTNILITGTPGTGKTTLAMCLAKKINYEYIDISNIVKQNKLFENFDEKYESYVLSEDKLLDFLQEKMESKNRGIIIDYHSSDFFPKQWFDLVFILRCEETKILYDRLVNRGYNEKKLRDNIECEIFGISSEEAFDSYDVDCIFQIKNESLDQLSDNINYLTKIVLNFENK